MFGWASLPKLTKQERLNRLKPENAEHIHKKQSKASSVASLYKETITFDELNKIKEIKLEDWLGQLAGLFGWTEDYLK